MSEAVVQPAPVVVAESQEVVKLFGKWSLDEVEVGDISLQDYIAVKGKHSTFLPHTAGRYASKRFRKAQVGFSLFSFLFSLFSFLFSLFSFLFSLFSFLKQALS